MLALCVNIWRFNHTPSVGCRWLDALNKDRRQLLRNKTDAGTGASLFQILKRHQTPQHPSTRLQPPTRQSPFPPSPRCPRHSQRALPGWQHKAGGRWPRGLREARRVPGVGGWSPSPVHLQGASGHPRPRGRGSRSQLSPKGAQGVGAWSGEGRACSLGPRAQAPPRLLPCPAGGHVGPELQAPDPEQTHCPGQVPGQSRTGSLVTLTRTPESAPPPRGPSLGAFLPLGAALGPTRLVRKPPPRG